MYNWYLSNYGNQYNKRKFVEGALYTKIFPDYANIIQPKPGCKIELKVTIANKGRITLLYIICDVKITNSYVSSINKLGIILKKETPNTYRKTQNDLGSMYVVGYGQKGDGKAGIYNLTQSSKCIKTVISKITDDAESYYHSIGLSDDIQRMKQISSQKNVQQQILCFFYCSK